MFYIVSCIILITFLSIVQRTVVETEFTCGAFLTLQTVSLAFLRSLLTVAAVPTDVLAPAVSRSHTEIL